jgi:hypothetical protein
VILGRKNLKIRRVHSLHPRLARLSRRARGGSSVEYLMILAGVVIPLGLLAPTMIRMISAYWERIAVVIRSPFG